MLTRRDRINSILMDFGSDPEACADIVDQIMLLYKSQDDIIHEIGPEGRHRLVVNGEASEWGASTDIVRNGEYVGTTDAFMNILFQVSRVKPVEGFITRSVQTIE